jgi:hypothetical protein
LAAIVHHVHLGESMTQASIGRMARWALAAAALASVFALAPSASAAPSQPCNGTFEVLHNDHVGRLQLPAGAYDIRVSGGLACGTASSLFAAFLQDYDGVLPRPWRYNVRRSGFGLFFVSPGGQPAFSVRFATRRRPGGGGQSKVVDCSGTFQVLSNDRIGPLRLPAGPYRITRLSVLSPSCRQASGLFTRFLAFAGGGLPSGWQLLPNDGAFVSGSLNYGFRVKRVVVF